MGQGASLPAFPAPDARREVEATPGRRAMASRAWPALRGRTGQNPVMPSRSNVLSRVVVVAGAALCAILFIAPCASAADAPAASVVIGVDEIVLDRPQAEWSQAYLQWIAAFARDSSPVADTSGASCAARQQGDVWFLASSDGTAPVTRTCVVPAGKTLFVPIATTMERSGNREPDCGSMARIAADNITHRVTRLSMTVDGRAVDNLASHRLATRDCFALGLRQTPRSAAKTAVADGYYVMLQPLPAGPHTIAVEARFDSTPLSTTYRLDVR
jgi:hypothetical protein